MLLAQGRKSREVPQEWGGDEPTQCGPAARETARWVREEEQVTVSKAL